MDIRTEQIDISQKEQIERIRKDCGNNLSASAFNSLYLWQEQMGLSVFISDDFFAVKCDKRGENTWFFPCGSKAAVASFIEKGMKEKSFSLCYIREEDVMWLEEKFPSAWKFEREAESDEYIYNIQELIGLRGRKYMDVRYEINRIVRENVLKTLPISDDNINYAIAIVSEWEKQLHSIGINELVDIDVSHKALAERAKLGIDGILVYIDEKPVAVYAGFPIDDNTIDAMVYKWSKDAPKDLVYYITREYARQFEGRYIYCNLEEDLGIPGLRLVKRKLRPESKNLIWRASQL